MGLLYLLYIYIYIYEGTAVRFLETLRGVQWIKTYNGITVLSRIQNFMITFFFNIKYVYITVFIEDITLCLNLQGK